MFQRHREEVIDRLEIAWEKLLGRFVGQPAGAEADAVGHHAAVMNQVVSGDADEDILAVLRRKRIADYRAELRFNHPELPPEAAEPAIHGFAGPIYYVWPMLRTLFSAAHRVAVHNRSHVGASA